MPTMYEMGKWSIKSSSLPKQVFWYWWSPTKFDWPGETVLRTIFFTRNHVFSITDQFSYSKEWLIKSRAQCIWYSACITRQLTYFASILDKFTVIVQLMAACGESLCHHHGKGPVQLWCSHKFLPLTIALPLSQPIIGSIQILIYRQVRHHIKDVSPAYLGVKSLSM